MVARTPVAMAAILALMAKRWSKWQSYSKSKNAVGGSISMPSGYSRTVAPSAVANWAMVANRSDSLTRSSAASRMRKGCPAHRVVMAKMGTSSIKLATDSAAMGADFRVLGCRVRWRWAQCPCRMLGTEFDHPWP